MYIGIDLGTSGVKTLLVNSKGEIIKENTKTYPLYIDGNNFSEQHPEDWLNATLNSLLEIIKGNEANIKGISFSGQMHGLVLLDENDKVIRPAILWNDQRTFKEVDYLNKDIGIKKILKETGNIAVTGLTAPKVLWVKKHERENFDKISKMMLPKDYLIYCLTGEFVTDYSDASGTLYFDVENKKYNKFMLETLQINEKMLPKPLSSYEKCGYLKEEIKEQLNLKTDVFVTPGGGDQAVGAVGTGVVNDGDINVSLGTSGVIFAASNNYQVDNKSYMHSFCHATDFYHLMAVTLSAAGSLQWWRDNFYKEESFENLHKNMINTPINDTLFYLPYLSGERSPINDPFVKASFIGANYTHTKDHFTRALLEGITFSLKQCYDIIISLGVKPNKVRLTGGGARNPSWAQMVSDIFNVEIETISVKEGPAYGAAILALVGGKEFNSIKDACETLIKLENKYYPNKENHLLYDRKYQKYLDLYPRLKTFFYK